MDSSGINLVVAPDEEVGNAALELEAGSASSVVAVVCIIASPSSHIMGAADTAVVAVVVVGDPPGRMTEEDSG